MSAAYTGYQVQLVLKSGDRIKGQIANVEDQAVYLEDVTFLDSKQQGQASLVVEGNKIQDLVVLDLPKGSRNGKKKKQPLKKQRELLPSSIPNGYSTTTDDETYNVQSSRNNTPKPADSRKTKKGKKRDEADWEDSNTELPEFDFQSNLAKFDKDSVFAELSATDSVDPAQRLVGHNKNSTTSTPVTNGDRPKTNYEIDEMVKTGSNWQDNWEQIKVDDQSALARLTEKLDQKQALKTEQKQQQQQQQQQPSRLSTSTPTNGTAFTVVKDGETEKLPLASPINLLEIERLAQDEYGFGGQLLVENAGSGIKAVVLKIFGASQTSRISSTNARANVNSPPLVLILVGNNRAGAKALNAGRQLSNSGVRVIGLLINDSDAEDELLQSVSEQLSLFISFGGKVVHSLNQLENLLKQIDSPLELVVDGLQGFDTNISDLMDSELTKAVQAIQWANRQGCHKLSIDIPSGLDAGSAHLADIDEPCFVESKFIVSVGLPLSAIVHAYSSGLIADNIHYLVDTGVPRKLFARGSLRKFDKNWFGTDTTVKLNVGLKD